MLVLAAVEFNAVVVGYGAEAEEDSSVLTLLEEETEEDLAADGVASTDTLGVLDG